MADFLTAYQVVLAHEGGYANDPDDTGGETYKGISRKNFPNWEGWRIIDLHRTHNDFPAVLDKSERLAQYAQDFYRKNFWNKMSLGKVKLQSIATELFDTGVNMGDKTAAMFLQIALNATNRNQRDYFDVAEDGKIGEQTLSALNAHPYPASVLKLLNIQQGYRYLSITRASPTQEKFLRSWLSRVAI
ncbi:MAG: hypothetical protein EOO01_11495 [Chitinophagaceae bacterium]|nr:MAG: hypothetical protein EOO01_11495 [Chitinophagaceae bacterium]